ncbi:MAG: hypothetical protein AUI14_03765 [Actinobacteria bacterium 13_2_20CM_2_71_6]|nr:MAG: hypothetical protein AUI14_03765 [Actinobacteria bacterium 13_2_20CM_2_71_6]
MTRLRTTVAVLGTAVLTATSLGVLAGSPASAEPFGYGHLNKIQQRLVSGLLAAELNGADPAARGRGAAPLAPRRASTADACTNHFGANVKVNQNCLNITDPDLQGRAQAQNETWIAVDPGNADHLVASYNDYRRGDGTCGVSYSLDGGRTWADATAPNGYARGGTTWGTTREYWQGSGDTSVAWDSRGNAYLSCQQFNRGNPTSPDPDQSSAFYVYRSTGANGASWNFPGHPVAENNDVAGSGAVLLDKQLLTVDNHIGSPFRDRVYVTWTTFAADGTAYIFAAHSADFGQTFSAPVLVSTTSTLCDFTFGLPTPLGTCNENQFSQPFTAPDGTLYVTYANFNTATTAPENRNQMLLSRSTDGGATFSAPVRVGFFNDLPDCPTYQNGLNPGRACVPEKGPSFNSIFRAANYPVGAVDPTAPNRVVVTYGSYISRNSNESTGCSPAGLAPDGNNLFTGVKTGTCNNDIVLSVSTNSGASFTGSTTDVRQLPVVTDAPGQARTDQFWQGADFAPNGTLAVSYYDRQYGADENIGFSDITVSSASGSLGSLRHRRATSGSMPPPTQFFGTFYGDYAGIAVTNRAAYPIWSDTRPVDLFLCPGTGTSTTPPAVCQGGATNASIANDQDPYTTAVPLG